MLLEDKTQVEDKKRNTTYLITVRNAVPEGSCKEKRKKERLIAFLEDKTQVEDKKDTPPT